MKMNSKITTLFAAGLILLVAAIMLRHAQKKQNWVESEKNSQKIWSKTDNTVSNNDMRAIKSSIVYESIVDQTRSIDKVSDILKETNAQYIHRSFFRWRGFAEIERKHDVYSILKKNINTIKRRNHNVVVGGSVAFQEINVVEHDPFTGETIPKEKTWEMTLDPQKYGFSMGKEELQRKYWKITGNEKYLMPDIANQSLQALFIDIVKKQIDAGADAIWIDGLFAQAGVFARLSKNVNHPAIEKSLKAASNIVSQIRKYGESKGKYIYIGSWSYEKWYKYGLVKELYPKLDFVTMSPSSDKIKNKKLDQEKWKEKIRITKEIQGNIPIIVFIDWAFTSDSPLGVFSQKLDSNEQKEVLKRFDKFFSENNVIFSYPVHGGNLGRDAKKISFGRYGKYDALAPEFNTYETIKELSLDK